jgi:hypothetical protein
MTNKPLWLGIVHITQMKVPTPADIINGFQYTEEVKEALKGCKEKGDVQKAIKKLIKKHTEQIILEQVFLSDSKNKKQLENASIIIDVDTKQVIKNRFSKERQQELIDMYLTRYADKIEQFRKQFGRE